VAEIFGTVLLPILLIVGLGAVLQHFHPVDMSSLSKLQIYLFVPIFLFYYVYTSTLSWQEMAGIAGAVVLAKVLLALPLYFFLSRTGVHRETTAVVLLSSAIFNAGNFGIPVAVRAFGEAGGAVQALVVMVANLSLWGVGYGVMATMAGRGARSAVIGYLKLPMVYCLIAAFILRGLKVTLPEPLIYSARTIANGLIPLALITLGAQLSHQAARGRTWPKWRVVLPVVALKLFVLPAVMALICILLHLWPWPGAMLIVAAAGPTAVNTLLLAIEQKGDIELAAECVFWTTLLSGLSVTLILYLVTSLGGKPG
jgi:predicted permease